RGLGDFEPQFQQLTVDPRSAPGRILRRHGPDEVAKLEGDSRSADAVAQYQPNPARCQRTTVSGFTTTSTLAHWDHQRRRPSQNRRSPRVNFGRGFLRFRTLTCWRKAMSSSPRSCRERKNAANQETKARRSRIIGPVYTTCS